MIDHVSVGVIDLHKAAEFYRAVFAPLGVSQVIEKPGSIGFGKKYPEFWINERSSLAVPGSDNGTHVCLRAASKEVVIEFYNIAMANGASSSGEPGYREEYRAPDYRDATHPGYYAAFIRDPYENHVEVVTFVTQ
ncbi:VOC family protein [Halieaceae bacterium IMCC14734]|uniref:VOC family protein n=1 Tax=Candidatus Litorirhabdus singularis TaxID=2518993 RepID=A0ABT3TLM3_9GAMM|nr:VOC family protein [Candidatus Litorirhabdus singularis]MCX2983151.1 VOC family protein [Candidatus Litorirhabdus singularis]